MSRTSTNRRASVNTTRPTPAVKRVPMTSDTGRKSHVHCAGRPVTRTMSANGMRLSRRFTSPTRTADATNTERGM